MDLFQSIALPLAARGLKVMPVDGKKAFLPKHPQEATSSPNKIANEWRKYADCNVAVHCLQEQGGTVIIDVDGPDIRPIYTKETGKAFPETYTVQSSPNKYHFYFWQTPKTIALPKNIVEGDTNGEFSLRVKNYYVVGEGSIHPEHKGRYTALLTVPVVPMPDDLFNWLVGRANKNSKTGDFTKKPEGWIYEPLVHHNINNGLTKIAGYYIQNKNIDDADMLYTILMKHADEQAVYEDGNPFPCNEDEIRKIAEGAVSRWKTGEEKRRLETPLISGVPVGTQPASVSTLPVENDDGPAWGRYGLTKEEYEVEMDKDYPVLKFAEEQPGPTWDDDMMYGIAGTIIRKASEYCEAHPAGMYLDLLIAMGSIFGHQPRCRIHPAAHYTNEFGLRVGLTSTGRKGTGDNAINEVIKHVDSHWYQHRRISRFGSAEAIINEVRDPFVQQIRVGGRKDGPQFKEITVPGVDDKRLFIRVGEFSAVLDLVNKRDSGAASVMRLGWDGDALDDVVKGKSNDGISNSVRCAEPHISIFADTTKSELISKMPAGADENGFGNRFLYCYAYRTKLCPNGGPELDWGQEVARLIEAVEFAQDIKHVPMTKVAHKVWSHMYEEMERTRPGGMLGLMVTRGPAHVRRLAMILALLDLNDAVETKHLHAAKKFWDYCEESARYIFTGYTKDQFQILKWVESKQSVTVTEIARDLFHWNRKAAWVRTQVNDLARQGYLAVAGEQVKSKKERAA